METQTKQALMDKNQKLIDMIIERVKRDFPKDIAIIGLTGSFATGDYHEKSDLDLIIINNTERGWEIAETFILDGVGYDIYCTEWHVRVENEANLESPMVSHLLDLQILYCASPEDAERLQRYQQRARKRLSEPIGADCLGRAAKNLEHAKQSFAQLMLEEAIGKARYAAGLMLYDLFNAVVSMNNTYIKRGVKRYLEEIRTYSYVPKDFETLYYALIQAQTIPDIQEAAKAILKATLALHESMLQELVPRPQPTSDHLKGTYEELFCNYHNKIIQSTQKQDVSYAFLTMIGAQAYLDEMTQEVGTPAFDLLQAFDPEDLTKGEAAFLQAEEKYKAEYDKVGLTVNTFDTLEELYRHFMNPA